MSNFRQNSYNEGQFYQLLPVFRKSVVPGESLELDINSIFQTVPFTRNIQSGGIATMYAFYVPHRLVWSDWVGFVARDPDVTATTVPQTSNNFDELFERSTQARSALFRRAYKLAYNQYFGSDVFGNNSWYADITADSDASMKFTRITDQLVGKLMFDGDVTAPTYVAPVTGTSPNQVATVTLNDFRQAMANAYSKRRGQMTGDKYVDAMARMGVSLDWRVQNAPELIGTSKLEFFPKETKSTEAATLGEPVAYFREQMRLKTRRTFAAEHGYIFAAIVIRPHCFVEGCKGPIDQWPSSIDDIFLGDNQVGSDTVSVSNLCTGTGTARTPRFEYLLSGQNILGKTSASGKSWAALDSASSFDKLVYNEMSIPQLAGILDKQLAVTSSCVAVSRSPVRQNVF